MPAVSVAAGNPNSTHDISLSDGSTTYGFSFAQSTPRVLQEMPLSAPAQSFDVTQKNWIGGKGRLRYQDDPTGFAESVGMWTTTDGRIFTAPQWRFASGLRNCDEHLPGDNETMVWWKLYGNTPGSQIARYLSIAVTGSANFDADKAYIIVRKRGTPTGVLTVKQCADGSGKPGSANQTVTLAVASQTDTLAVYKVFDWAGTQAITVGGTYYLEFDGNAGDDATNHWEILCASTGAGLYSANGTTWAAASVAPFYRVVDADTNRKWWFFQLEGMMYAVSQNDNVTASLLKMNGVRGTATAGAATSLTDSNLSMTADQYIGAWIKVYEGTGAGQTRQITDNDATSFTVATWDKNPDNTSKYFVYATKYMNAVTGTPGLGVVTAQPVVANKICHFPQAQTTAIQKMRVNAASHDYAADSTNKADVLYLSADPTTGAILWRANGQNISSGAIAAWGANITWGADLPVAGSDYNVTNFIDFNTLHVMKEDGPFTFENSRLRRVGVGFDKVPDADNGKAVAVQGNYLYFGWGHSVERMIGANVSDMLNWKAGYQGDAWARRGTIVQALSVVGWLFFAIDGGSSNYSSVICWNGTGWHEVFRGWASGVRIRNIFWQPCEETRGRLWIDINGELVYIEFPSFAANPLADSTLNYQYEGSLITSTIDANDSQLYKLIHQLRILLDSGASVEVDYQKDQNVGTSNWTLLSTASTSPKSDITVDSGATFQIRFRLRFQVTNSRTPTIVSGTVVSGRMIPLPKYQWVGQYAMSTDMETLIGEPDNSPDTMISQLKTWATQQTKLTLRSVSASMDNKVVTISLPAKSISALDDESWDGVVSFVCMEA